MSSDNTIVDHDVCIRPARPADFDQLHAFDIRVFGQLAYPYFALRQLFDALPNCWLVADHPLGLIGYSFGVPSTDRLSAWLLGLAVDPDHRNLGYGRRLTIESLNLLRALGVVDIYLTVEPGNEVAIALYRTFGFTPTGHRPDYFGPGEDRILMVRRAPGSSPITRRNTVSGVIPAPRPGMAHEQTPIPTPPLLGSTKGSRDGWAGLGLEHAGEDADRVGP